mmetsp:Transcript_4165/g.13696  ORF Transcript_4165/g.13696 Transcript_4165/m.13696 type:complete len:331 (-) Transcript_4165:2724-3716(-)
MTTGEPNCFGSEEFLAKSGSIVMSVRGRAEFIEVFHNELPEDPSDIIEMLRAELAPLESWCEFALAYYDQHRHEQFRDILLSVVDAFDVYELQDLYRQDRLQFKTGRLRILNLLAASSTSTFAMHRVRSDVRDTLTNATLHFIGRADEIDTNYPDTMLCKAIFWMNQCSSDGRALENAAYYASAVLRLKNCSMAAKLANGIIAFHERSYCQALGLFLASLQYKQPFRGTIYAAIGVCAMCLDEMRVVRPCACKLMPEMRTSWPNPQKKIVCHIPVALEGCGPDLKHIQASCAFERALALEPTNVGGLVFIASLRAANVPFYRERAGNLNP